MREFRHSDMNGSLFKNDKKRRDRDPDYKGSGVIDDEDVWIAAWKKTSEGGRTYLSIAFTYKNDKEEPPRSSKRRAKQERTYSSRRDPIDEEREERDEDRDLLDDDIPF
jgi:hypothetical protein